jgi:hypothetical protein
MDLLHRLYQQLHPDLTRTETYYVNRTPSRTVLCYERFCIRVDLLTLYERQRIDFRRHALVLFAHDGTLMLWPLSESNLEQIRHIVWEHRVPHRHTLDPRLLYGELDVDQYREIYRNTERLAGTTEIDRIFPLPRPPYVDTRSQITQQLAELRRQRQIEQDIVFTQATLYKMLPQRYTNPMRCEPSKIVYELPLTSPQGRNVYLCEQDMRHIKRKDGHALLRLSLTSTRHIDWPLTLYQLRQLQQRGYVPMNLPVDLSKSPAPWKKAAIEEGSKTSFEPAARLERLGQFPGQPASAAPHYHAADFTRTIRVKEGTRFEARPSIFQTRSSSVSPPPSKRSKRLLEMDMDYEPRVKRPKMAFV